MSLRALPAIILTLQLSAAAFGHHFRYTARLTGPGESPPSDSDGLGHVVVRVDFDINKLRINATFDDLAGSVTEAHIHAPTANVGSGTAIAATPSPSFSGFPLGVTSGDYEGEFDLALASSYDPAFITQSGGTVGDAYSALGVALINGKAYFDIHSTAFPYGEIRGFLSYVEGDYNDNGTVDAADCILWRKTYHGIGEEQVADSNNDEFIDEADYTAWRQNFGNVGLSYLPGSGASLAASVPEPGVISLVSLALLAPRRRMRSA
jgi:hypothetical protein